MKTDYDYIVIGSGGIGSAALYWLARCAGSNVLGIEQFKLFHANGGPQDHSRIIRYYYHKECYARLTPHTHAAWATVAGESGVQPVTKTCLYTMPPDRDFVLDSLPGHPNIFVAIGAGHAYKFSSLLGQILSELVIDGTTAHDISAFSLRRPAIVTPATAELERYR